MRAHELSYCDGVGVERRFRARARSGYRDFRAIRRGGAARARLLNSADRAQRLKARFPRRLREDLALLTGALNTSRHTDPAFRAHWRPLLQALLEADCREGLVTLERFARALERQYELRAPRPERWDPSHCRARRFKAEIDAIMTGWTGVWQALVFEFETDARQAKPLTQH